MLTDLKIIYIKVDEFTDEGGASAVERVLKVGGASIASGGSNMDWHCHVKWILVSIAYMIDLTYYCPCNCYSIMPYVRLIKIHSVGICDRLGAKVISASKCLMLAAMFKGKDTRVPVKLHKWQWSRLMEHAIWDDRLYESNLLVISAAHTLFLVYTFYSLQNQQ